MSDLRNLERGVRITMPDIVQWTLLPEVSGDQLRIAAVQLALNVLARSVRQDFEAFFADHEDVRVNLAATGTGSTTWDPTLDLTS